MPAGEATLFVSVSFSGQEITPSFKLDYPEVTPAQAAAWLPDDQRARATADAERACALAGTRALTFLGVRFHAGEPAPALKYYGDVPGSRENSAERFARARVASTAMSKIAPTIVSCPRCDARQRARLFDSLNADRVPAQVELVRAGTFELVRCDGCGHAYRPEHTMLYAHFTARAWIIMHPRADRPRFATIERGVELVMAQQLAAAPPLVASGASGVRPRLVFGQHLLTEAVRALDAGLDVARLECAKLLAVRRNMERLMPLGPFELCFEERAPDGALVHAVHALATGDRLDAFSLAPDALDEASASRAELARRFPELFERPYVSACRYLYGATV